MRRDAISVVVLALFIALAFGSGETKSTSSKGSGTSTPASKDTATPEAAAPGSQWSYFQREDAMAKGTSYEASVKSTNTVNFSFPYAGEQHATLTLRTHPRYGKNIIFSIQKGQIQCTSYSGCKVLARFDDAPAVNYSAVGPEDNSSDAIFIRDYTSFVGKMLKSKKVRIEASIYQEGAPSFEFDVTGFDDAKYKPKK